MATEPRVAALPMYDWPEVQWANDALWTAVREGLESAGLKAAKRLDRERPPHSIWTDPSLLLVQTCAWPFVTRLAGKVALLGTPVYAAEGCSGPYYRSMIVVAAGQSAAHLQEMRGKRFAFNSRDSLSGYIALRAAMQVGSVAEDEVDWVETGGHRNSIRAVAEGRADLAAIDCVCWALAQDHEAEAIASLRVLHQTPLRPGLPLVTAISTREDERQIIRQAVRHALGSNETQDARKALFLAGFEEIGEPEYRALTQLAV